MPFRAKSTRIGALTLVQTSCTKRHLSLGLNLSGSARKRVTMLRRIGLLLFVLIAKRLTLKRCAHSSLKKPCGPQSGVTWENSDIAGRFPVLSMQNRKTGSDVLLPRPSPDAHAEALWKQEGTKCCQFLRNRAHGGRGAGGAKWRKCRSNTQRSEIVHGPVGTTHNLKVVSSNLTPATKLTKHIRYLRSAPRGAFCCP